MGLNCLTLKIFCSFGIRQLEAFSGFGDLNYEYTIVDTIRIYQILPISKNIDRI